MSSHLNYPPFQRYLTGSFLALVSRHADKLWDLNLTYLECVKNTTQHTLTWGRGDNNYITAGDTRSVRKHSWKSPDWFLKVWPTSQVCQLINFLSEGGRNWGSGWPWLSFAAGLTRLFLIPRLVLKERGREEGKQEPNVQVWVQRHHMRWPLACAETQSLKFAQGNFKKRQTKEGNK